MSDDAKILKLDTNRIRPGIRSKAQRLYVELANPLNSNLWKSLPTASPERISAKEILGTLGNISELWQHSDANVANRVIHMSLLTLHAIHTGQYQNKEIIGFVMDMQSAAQSVIDRLEVTQNVKRTAQS